jgi:hypothetical protein
LSPAAVAGVLPLVVLELVSTKMDVILEPEGTDHGQLHMTWEAGFATNSGLPEVMI